MTDLPKPRMRMNVYRRVVNIGPISKGWGQVSGDIKPVTLECGHVLQMNPIHSYNLGEAWRCSKCEEDHPTYFGDREIVV